MNKLIFVFLLSCLSIGSYAQLLKEDKDLILLSARSDTMFKEHKVSYGFGGMHKLNPINLTAGSLLFFYQKFISVQISSGCLYSISCSSYSKQLFGEYGFGKALMSTGDRLMRCDRLSEIDIPKLHINKRTHKADETVDYYHNCTHHDH